MISRHPVTALSRLKMEEYQKAITFFHDIVHLFREMQIGEKEGWKPLKTGDNGININCGHTGEDADTRAQVCVNVKVHTRLP